MCVYELELEDWKLNNDFPLGKIHYFCARNSFRGSPHEILAAIWQSSLLCPLKKQAQKCRGCPYLSGTRPKGDSDRGQWPEVWEPKRGDRGYWTLNWLVCTWKVPWKASRLIFPLNWLALRQAVSSGLVRPQVSKYYDKKTHLIHPGIMASSCSQKNSFLPPALLPSEHPASSFPLGPWRLLEFQPSHDIYILHVRNDTYHLIKKPFWKLHLLTASHIIND